MAPKLVRTAIYAVTALVLLLVYVRSGSKDAAPASPLASGPTEPLLPVPDEYDAAVDLHNILNQTPYAPVIIFSKSYCPHCKRAKKVLFDDHALVPAPQVVELDLHPHGQELQAELHKQTGRRTVPNVVVAKKSRGGADDIVKLSESGALKAKFEEWAQGYLKVD